MKQATESAILLVAHGSPDPDWRRPLEAMHLRLQALAAPRPVRLAYMEFSPPSVIEATMQLRDDGCKRALVLAAFLSPGGRHIKEHLPAIVRDACEQVPEVELDLLPGSLGNEPEVVEALSRAALRLATVAGE